ncbi:hypothetical protein BCV60_17865 [Bacillus halotolerans]|nr:hypothetical protein BCV60_17865 [Bacillus halotolerans]
MFYCVNNSKIFLSKSLESQKRSEYTINQRRSNQPSFYIISLVKVGQKQDRFEQMVLKASESGVY